MATTTIQTTPIKRYTNTITITTGAYGIPGALTFWNTNNGRTGEFIDKTEVFLSLTKNGKYQRFNIKSISVTRTNGFPGKSSELRYKTRDYSISTAKTNALKKYYNKDVIVITLESPLNPSDFNVDDVITINIYARPWMHAVKWTWYSYYYGYWGNNTPFRSTIAFDKNPPVVKSISLNNINTQLTVVFNEPVYKKDTRNRLDKDNINLFILTSGGGATIESFDSPITNDNITFLINFKVKGFSGNGKEKLLFTPINLSNINGIRLYRSSDIYLQIPPKVKTLSLNNDNSELTVVFNEVVYQKDTKHKPLSLNNFNLSIRGNDKATIDSINSITTTDNITFSIDFKVNNFLGNGQEELIFKPLNISNEIGPAVENTTDIKLQIPTPSLETNSLNNINTQLTLAFNTSLYKKGTKNKLDKSNFGLSIRGNDNAMVSINDIKIDDNKTFTIYFKVNNFLGNGQEVLTFKPLNISNFEGVDLVNTTDIILKIPTPKVETISLNKDNNKLSLAFNTSLYQKGTTNKLKLSNFDLSITGGNATIDSINSITTNDNKNFLIDFKVNNFLGNGKEVLTFKPLNISNFKSVDLVNTTDIKLQIPTPEVKTISLNNINTQLTLAFNTSLYKKGTTNKLDKDNFGLSITGGGTISSIDSIQTTDNLNFLIDFKVNNFLGNGQEVLTFTPLNISNFDSTNLVNSTDIKLQIPPKLETITINDDNSELTLVFNEIVYKKDTIDTPLSLNNFNLSITGGNGNAIVSSVNYIETSDNKTFILYITLSNLLGNGQEVLSVTPVNISNEIGPAVEEKPIEINVNEEIQIEEDAIIDKTDGYTNSWDKTSDVIKDKSFVQPRFRFMNKNTFIDSGERTKRLANVNIMKTINKETSDKSNKMYKLKNKQVVKFNNHTNLLRITKGYSLLNSDCRSDKKICRSLNDSNHSFEDLQDAKKLGGGGNDKLSSQFQRGFQTSFKIDKCNIANGLITHIPELKNVKRTDHNLNIHKKIFQINTNKCKNPDSDRYLENPKIHEINHRYEHNHYYPISREEEGTTFGYYVHKHTTHPHTSKKVPNYNFDYYIDRYARFSMNFYPNK